MKFLYLIGLASLFASSQLRAKEVLLIVGISGEQEYQDIFAKNVELWTDACKKAGVPIDKIGLDPEETDLKQKIQNRLAKVGNDELWLVLIGHGSFDGRIAKFNIAGEDFNAKELAQWCKPITGNLVVINTASASAPFLTELAGENRTIITATKSPNEIFYPRFGEYFASAINGVKEADLDNDNQVSLLEAYLYSSNQVTEFYTQAGRLATEHALIEDNGDGLATRAEWFEGVSAIKTAKDGAEPDGLRAMQQVLVYNDIEKNFPEELRNKRDKLETEVRLIRRQKPELTEEEYYGKLETLLKQLARIYQQVENPTPKPPIDQ